MKINVDIKHKKLRMDANMKADNIYPYFCKFKFSCREK